VLRDAHKLNI